jgi:hypothetical protein
VATHGHSTSIVKQYLLLGEMEKTPNQNKIKYVSGGTLIFNFLNSHSPCSPPRIILLDSDISFALANKALGSGHFSVEGQPDGVLEQREDSCDLLLTMNPIDFSH